jgi:uncharacterized membrane protein YoaK (UPF0700 family)
LADSTAPEAAASIRHPLAIALLTLTFSTGLIDAASYLGLGRVFTANMTGNVVLLGFGLAGAGGLPIISPILSLAAFLVGSGLGAALGRLPERAHTAHLGATLALEVTLVAAAAILAAALDVHPNTFAGDTMVVILAFAMGARNATVRRIGVPDMTTTVLTMTLTGLAADSRLAGGPGTGTVRRTSAVVAMLTGAISGALLLKTSLALPLALAAVLVLAAGVAYVPPRLRGEASAAG